MLNELMQVCCTVARTTWKSFPRCMLQFESVQGMKVQLHILISTSVSAVGSCWVLAAVDLQHHTFPHLSLTSCASKDLQVLATACMAL